MNDHSLLYARGFCITREGSKGHPPWFRCLTLAGWQVSVDTRTGLSSATATDGRFVIIIGYVLDIEEGHDDGCHIAEALVEALSRSEAIFHSKLDSLGGRFAVFYGDRSRASILGDACATRTIFYSRTEPFIASHYEIVAKACGSGRSDHWKARRADRNRHDTFGYPAGATPDQSVGLLMANMVLRLGSMTYERFYPWKDLKALSVEDATNTLLQSFRTQLRILANRYRIVCSLTAGLDSRCTLAALQPFLQQAKFFSYSTQPKEEVDAAVAGMFAQKYLLDFELMPRQNRDSEEFQKFKSILTRNNYHSHNREAAYGYLGLFEPGDIHIRSNLYEIARAFYRAMRERPARLSAEEMARLYYRHYTDQDQDLAASFCDYMVQSNFENGIRNYDPYDIFYWEQRMSCWHALVLLEADPSVDTYLLMNSRSCLEAGLAVPLGDRKKSAVFKSLISTAWPELLEWPVNPKDIAALQ